MCTLNFLFTARSKSSRLLCPVINTFSVEVFGWKTRELRPAVLAQQIGLISQECTAVKPPG